MATEQLLKVAVILAAGAILVYLIVDYNTRSKKRDGEAFFAQSSSMPQPLQQSEGFRMLDDKNDTGVQPNDCSPRDRLTAADLLPKDAANSKWAQVNPAGQGDLKDQNFLTSGFHLGINTIGSSLRNANLQLRSEPVNPQGKWPIMQSTIEPDVNRRSLEIGGDF